MNKNKFRYALLALMTAFLLTLLACGSDDNTPANSKDNDPNTEENDNNDNDNDNNNNDENDKEATGDKIYSVDDFSQVKTNMGEPIEGGTFTFGLVSDTVFPGTLNPLYQQAVVDSAIINWFYEELLSWDENFFYTQDGAATYEVSEDGRTITFTIGDNVNWHDGEPVKAEDWAFSYEVLAHPEYIGTDYSATARLIEGIEEYHNGEADEISGIEIVDDKVMKITYVEASPALLTGGIYNFPMAKHIFGDMPLDEMESSPEVRQHPIGFGPFKVESIVPGESVNLSKNEDYWRGEPHLDEVIIKVIDPTVVVNELESGGVDTVSQFPADQFPDNADMDNVEFIGNISWGYDYLAFKLGDWDKEAREVKTDPNMKMANVNLRRAMGYAVDTKSVGERFYHGLQWPANAIIPPSHPEFHDETQEGFPYDPDKANELLDEAGYEWADGEEFRTDPDGEELVITFAAMTGGDSAEPIIRYYMQAWAEVGLNVELLDGRLHEFNDFYDQVGDGGNDNLDIDVFKGGWKIGKNVDPSRFYGRDAMFNFARYSNDEIDRLIEAGNSEKANDVEYRKEIYNEFQQLMVDEAPVIPLLNYLDVIPVNNRVHNYFTGHGTEMYRYEIQVTQDKPIVKGE